MPAGSAGHGMRLVMLPACSRVLPSVSRGHETARRVAGDDPGFF